jgi:PAS domain-containing protein
MSNHELDFTDARNLRMKAEEKLKGKQEKDMPLIEADVKKLLHELQVHQIELEMQNEELAEAYEKAETALKKYTMLYDFSPMGYFTLEKDGTVSELNFTAAEMLGEKRFLLVDSNFKLFISEDSRPIFNNFLKKVFASHTKESCELTLGYDKMTLCSVYMEGIVNDDDGNCLITVVDISAFKK